MIRDNLIIRRIRKGDKKQFELLFRSSYPSLVRYAKTLIKDHDTAEEIVQDLFFRLWQDRQSLKIEKSVSAYLYKSVYNRCLHHLEHMKVVEKHLKEALYRQEDETNYPTGDIQYKELEEKIARILLKLPERCNIIFCMNRFEGLKYAEIAQRLSISVKTVEANMGKALKEFRKGLKE